MTLGANASNSPTLNLRTETSLLHSNGEADLLLDSSDDIFLNTNTATRMFAGASGRVGEGSISPADLMHVSGDAVIGGGSSDYDIDSEKIVFQFRSNKRFSFKKYH